MSSTKTWFSDKISNGLFVQIIICKNIFPENKSQVHLSPPTFLENLEDVLLGSPCDLRAFNSRQRLTGMPRTLSSLHWEQYKQRVFRGQQPALLKVFPLLPLWCHVTFEKHPSSRFLPLAYISACMDYWDHVRLTYPPHTHSLLLICRATADVVLEPTSQHVAMRPPPPFNLRGTWRQFNQRHRTAHGVLRRMIWKQW